MPKHSPLDEIRNIIEIYDSACEKSWDNFKDFNDPKYQKAIQQARNKAISKLIAWHRAEVAAELQELLHFLSGEEATTQTIADKVVMRLSELKAKEGKDG